MGKVEASVEIAAPLADVWDLYFDRARWASWVDGLASVIREDGYPEKGGELSWRSTPAGRARVDERVTAHEARSLHRVAFVDPSAEGELEVRFEQLPAADAESGRRTMVTQRMTYSVTSGGPLSAIIDFLFIRSQQRRSLERSLIDLRLEAERVGGTRAGG